MVSSTNRKATAIEQPPLTASPPFPLRVKELGASFLVHAHRDATPKEHRCPLWSLLHAPLQQQVLPCSASSAPSADLQQPRSTATTAASESSTVVTPKALGPAKDFSKFDEKFAYVLREEKFPRNLPMRFEICLCYKFLLPGACTLAAQGSV